MEWSEERSRVEEGTGASFEADSNSQTSSAALM